MRSKDDHSPKAERGVFAKIGGYFAAGGYVSVNTSQAPNCNAIP